MSDDEQDHSGSNTKQLSPSLKFNNFIEFKNSLYSYAVRFGPYVVSSVNDYIDYPPPQHPGPNAPPDVLQNYRSDELAYIQYKRDCAYICSLVYNSLSTDVKLRFDSNVQAYRTFGMGQLGLLMQYLSEIVRKTGKNSIMPMFSKIINLQTKINKIGSEV